MKTIFSALFAGAAMLLLAGCLSVETVPAAETAPAAPAGNAVENPVKKEAEKAAPARPSRGAAEEEAIRFAGPGRNPVVVFDAGFSSKPADPECGGAMKQLADAGYTELFRFSCDPKLDIPGNAAKLHEFLSGLRAQLQKKYAEKYPKTKCDIRFDLFAPGVSGLLARYYLRYGGQLLPENGISLPLLDWRGAGLVDKVILVGTPSDGTLGVFAEMVGRTLPDPAAPVLSGVPAAASPAAYQMLPGVNGGTVHYADAPDGPALDLFDPAVWSANRWGLADPAVQAASKDAAERLDLYLRRARQFRTAMDTPAQPPKNVALFLFVGNGVPTASRLLVDRRTGRLSIADYAPGDGRATVASARFDRRGGKAEPPFSQSPILWQAVTHLPVGDADYFRSDSFWDDVRYYLLMFPTDRQRELYHLNRK